MSVTPRPVEATEGSRPMEPCSRCALVHKGCAGHRKDGQPCGKRPIKGGRVCQTHGGGAPQVKAAAARRLAERRVASEMASFLEGLSEDAARLGPREVLLEQLWRAAAMARLLELKVGEGGEASLLGENHLGDQVEHPLAGMLRHWTVEAARLAKLALDAGFEAERIRLVEGQAEIVAGVVRAVGQGVLELLGRLGGAKELVAGVESELPKVMRGALELARANSIDVNESKGA